MDVLRTVTVPLWVLTDRATFSAASNLATELEALSTVRFAGEPMGGGLNFWDEVEFIKLEHLPIPVQVGLSTEYFERSTPEGPSADHRTGPARRLHLRRLLRQGAMCCWIGLAPAQRTERWAEC